MQWIELDEAVEENRCDVGHAHRHAGMPGVGLLNAVHNQRPNCVCHIAFRDGFGFRHFLKQSLRIHRYLLHEARFLRSINCMISGVRMSCMARSSLLPGTTIELARDMKELWIIDSR